MVDAKSIRDAYLRRYEEYQNKLRDICRKQRVDLVQMTTDRPFADALHEYLSVRAWTVTLLNGILAFGALALQFHSPSTCSFNRFRVLDWGAMHLLEAVVRINRRRLQLMHLLLLLLRCLIPILLAYCLARPVLTGFRVLPVMHLERS